MPRTADYPASKFIRFLSSYGPGTDNKGMFDENVNRLSKKYAVEPFQLTVEYEQKIVDLLRNEAAVSVLVAGEAGDGKTHLLHRDWLILKGDEEIWEESENPRLSIRLMDGRERNIVFVKDLTAWSSGSESLWKLIESAQQDPLFSIIIACNHGQILSQLKGNDSSRGCCENLEEIFFQRELNKKINHISVFDLSRTSQDKRLEEIIKNIVTHEKWNVCVDENCKFVDQCPIRRNLRLLWNNKQNIPTVTTNRLCELVKIAGMDGNHFPIRELFLLVVNGILGNKTKGNDKLGNCHVVKRILEDKGGSDENNINLFENIFGENLTEGVRFEKRIFRRLAFFEIGKYSDPYFDNLIFGEINIPLSRDNKEYRDKCIQKQRREKFFTWEGDFNREKKLWALSAYKHIPSYLSLVKGLEEWGGEDEPDSVICQGLNRVMTGSSLQQTEDQIRIATNGANSKDPVGLYVVCAMDMKNKVRIKFVEEGSDSTPVLIFENGSGVRKIDLYPRRYEFLACLASGCVPSAFSTQSQSEFYSLKSVLINDELNCNYKNKAKRRRITFIDGARVSFCVK